MACGVASRSGHRDLCLASPLSPRRSGATARPRPRRRSPSGSTVQWKGASGYSEMQSHPARHARRGLSDSPAGLAAWIIEKFDEWSDGNDAFDLDRPAHDGDDLLGHQLDRAIVPPYFDHHFAAERCPSITRPGRRHRVHRHESEYPREMAERNYADLRSFIEARARRALHGRRWCRPRSRSTSGAFVATLAGRRGRPRPSARARRSTEPGARDVWRASASPRCAISRIVGRALRVVGYVGIVVSALAFLAGALLIWRNWDEMGAWETVSKPILERRRSCSRSSAFARMATDGAAGSGCRGEDRPSPPPAPSPRGRGRRRHRPLDG